MLNRVSKSLLFSLLLCIFITSQAQLADSTETAWTNNHLLAQIGPFTWHVDYERTVFHRNRYAYLAKVGVGKIYAFDYYGEWAHLSIGMLMGDNRQFADLDVGVGYFQTNGLEAFTFTELMPVVHAGYRYQTKHFLWRLGSGFPDALYTAVGISF